MCCRHRVLSRGLENAKEWGYLSVIVLKKNIFMRRKFSHIDMRDIVQFLREAGLQCVATRRRAGPAPCNKRRIGPPRRAEGEHGRRAGAYRHAPRKGMLKQSELLPI